MIGTAQTLQTCLRWNCLRIGFTIFTEKKTRSEYYFILFKFCCWWWRQWCIELLMMMMMVMIRVLRWWHGNALACGANDPMLQHQRQNIWSVQSLSSSLSSIIPWEWFRHWQRHCKKYPLISSAHHHNCNHYQTWKQANHDMIAT